MKIAYVGNFSQRHCTEVHLAATLEKLGHEVIRIQEDTTPAHQLSAMIEIADWGLFLFTRTWGDLVTMGNLAQLRERKIPSASYHLDLYIGLKREEGLDNDPFWRTDYVFTPDGDPASAEVFKAKRINHFYMKPGVFEPECYIDEERGGGPDVLFVGGGSATGQGPQYGHTSEWPYRGELIKFLQETYPDQFMKKGWPQETVRNEELNRLYADTKVVVGDSLCPGYTKPRYWSDRVYETIGRGGFLIMPYIKGLEEEFTDGKTIVFYEYGNFAQLQEKINYYLEHDEAREKIQKAGFEFVEKNCTYTQRLTKMLAIIFPPNNKMSDLPTELTPDKNDEVQLETPDLKISLGAGTEPESGAGWVNVDIVPLENIHKVHNLMVYPWPFADSSADYIKAKDIIEHMATHLPDGRSSIIAFIEECYRILKPGAILWIQTPAHNAPFLWIDPTHVRGFHDESFDFFDPETDFGRSTGFYSSAKFKTSCKRLENGNLQFTLEKRA